MDRRTFIQKSYKSCLLLTACGLSGTIISSCSKILVHPASVENNVIRIPKSVFSAEETLKIIRTPDSTYDVLLRKKSEDEYSATLMKCTHYDNGLVATSKGFTCNLHGSRFNESGEVTNGPANRPLIQYQTTSTQSQIIIHL